jgi:hypothetical protein
MGLNEREQKRYEELGVKKVNLKDGAYYRGHCRNADVAIWHAATNQFYYIRSKFGSEFVESLPGPEDTIDGMDYFLPMKELAEAPFEIKVEEDCRGMRRWDGKDE